MERPVSAQYLERLVKSFYTIGLTPLFEMTSRHSSSARQHFVSFELWHEVKDYSRMSKLFLNWFLMWQLKLVCLLLL